MLEPACVAWKADPMTTTVTSNDSSRVLLTGVGIIVGSLVLGGLTSAAQGLLPGSLRSFANSPSGWTLLTVVLIAAARPRMLPAAVLGAVSFVCLVLGYTIVSELRGLSYSPLFWGAIGVVAGPVIGWSTAAAFARGSLLNTFGSSLIAGVLITDAVYGLTVTADTTSPVYWWIVGVAGVLVLVLCATRRRLSGRYLALLLGLTLVWFVLGTAGYSVLNGVQGS